MRTISDTIERLSKFRGRPVGAEPLISKFKSLRGSNQIPDNLGLSSMFPNLPMNPLLSWSSHTAARKPLPATIMDRVGRSLPATMGLLSCFQSNPGRTTPICVSTGSRRKARDRGEVMSIRAMVNRMVSEHGVDPKRVFVTGLSAGGAMANALLATYPEVFADGAITPGLPYGVASTVPKRD